MFNLFRGSHFPLNRSSNALRPNHPSVRIIYKLSSGNSNSKIKLEVYRVPSKKIAPQFYHVASSWP